MSMDPDTLRFLQDNVPEATEEAIREAYEKCEGNMLEALTLLLEVPLPKEKVKTEWDERREIFDAYDQEMQKMLQGMRNVQLQKGGESRTGGMLHTVEEIPEGAEEMDGEEEKTPKESPSKRVKVNPIFASATKTI